MQRLYREYLQYKMEGGKGSRRAVGALPPGEQQGQAAGGAAAAKQGEAAGGTVAAKQGQAGGGVAGQGQQHGQQGKGKPAKKKASG